jgi:hypothetical protein
MAVRITVTDGSTGATIDVDLEPWNTVEEVVESAAAYWEKEIGAYVARFNQQVLQGEWQIQQLSIQEGEVIEIIPDPEGG